MNYIITTPRLGLRNWHMEDLEAAMEMNGDPEVMQFFPQTYGREATVGMIEKFQNHFHQYGYTYYAVDRLEGEKCLGFIGLMHQDYEAPFTPCTDIGWRLRKKFWGKGYATEGAKACLEYARKELKLNEIISTTSHNNLPSRRVMEKIGMSLIEEFMHPKVPDLHPLQPSVWYKIKL